MSTPPILARPDLDRAHCETPGCGHTEHGPLFLHQRCHTGAGKTVAYMDGIVTVTCKKCDAFIAAIAVAHEWTCELSPISSRTCERGTRCCTVKHGARS